MISLLAFGLLFLVQVIVIDIGSTIIILLWRFEANWKASVVHWHFAVKANCRRER